MPSTPSSSADAPASPSLLRQHWWIIGIFAALALASVLGRAHSLNTRPTTGRFFGGEPESHILVTDLAFDEMSWRTHYFLPIFNFAAPSNKHIDQHPGSTSPDKEGNYYYCSTPPLTFILPYLTSKLTGGPTLAAQRWYNVSLQLAAALAMAALVYACGGFSAASREMRLLAGLSAGAIYLTAPECLLSHSYTLWAQQFYAALLPVQILLFLFRPNSRWLFFTTVLCCMEDWTPYVATGGMTAIALYAYWKDRDKRSLKVAATLVGACAVSGLLIVAWFSLHLTIAEYFAALARRSGSRSGNVLDLLKLVPRYLNSLGLFLFLGALALWWRPWQRRAEGTAESRLILPKADPLGLACVITAFALIENLLMRQHAVIYSFDRLKAVQLVALFFAWGAYANLRRARWAFGLSVVVGVASLSIFLYTFTSPKGWAYVRKSQQELLGEVIRKTASDGPVFFNHEVRGAEVYYAGRNIFESVADQAAGIGMEEKPFILNWCKKYGFTEATVYDISGEWPYPLASDFPRHIDVHRVHVDGSTEDLGTFPLDESAQLDFHDSKSRYGQDATWRYILKNILIPGM